MGNIFRVFGWLSLAGGVITALAGMEDATSSYHPDASTLCVGLGIVALSLVFLFNSALLNGIKTLVQNAEYQKAVIENDYTIKDVESGDDEENVSEKLLRDT